MTDPERLDQVGSTLARAMLRAGQVENPGPHVAARAMGTLGLASTVLGTATAVGTAQAAAGTGAAAAAPGAAAATTALMVAKWTGVGLLVGVGTGIGVSQMSGPAQRARAPVPAASAVPTPAARSPSLQSADPPPAPSVVPVPDPVPAVVSRRAAPSAPASAFPVSSALADEARALEAARAALGRGDPAGTLAALDQYRRWHGVGHLAIEADYLRMEALYRQGNRPAAAAVARRLLRAHPSGPHAARARSIAGEKIEGSNPDEDGMTRVR